MKTENMKLLDLKTGKYLELGKDWHYCGNRIYLVRYLKKCITSFNKFLRGQVKTLAEYKEIDGQRNIGYELACKVATSDDECVNNAVDAQVDSGYVEKSEQQGKLKTLCDKTGAVVYGDRYIFLRSEECGNVYSFAGKVSVDNLIDFQNAEGNFSNGKALDEQNFKPTFLGNLFEEYSKQLRKEANKFEELMEKLK